MSETTSYAAIGEILPGLPKLVEELKRLGFGVFFEADRVSRTEFHIKLVISNYPVDIDAFQEQVESSGIDCLVNDESAETPAGDDEIPF